MKIKNTILLLSVVLSGSVMAQKVTHFAGIPNDVDPNAQVNNTTCSLAEARFYNPEGMAWDSKGMWITEKNKIRYFYNNQFYNRAGFGSDGDLSASYVNGTGVNAYFARPTSVALDASGVLYIVDKDNHAIRRMDAFSNTTIPQEVKTFAGAAAINQNGTEGKADGQGTAARFSSPQSIVRNTDGSFYVTDWFNSTIRKISAGGSVETLAGTAGVIGGKDGKTGVSLFDSPYGIAMLDADNVIISDQVGGTIRKIKLSTYDVTTIAGVYLENDIIDGTLATARFSSPRGIAVAYGRIFVCDGTRIRMIDIANNRVTTFAGSGTQGNKDGTGTTAEFGELAGLAYNTTTKILYVTDHLYNVIKTVTVSPNSIRESLMNISLSVSPNPSTGIYTLQSLLATNTVQLYEVMDISGKVLLSHSCNNSLNENIDLSTYTNGIYFLKVTTANGSNTLRLQKI